MTHRGPGAGGREASLRLSAGVRWNSPAALESAVTGRLSGVLMHTWAASQHLCQMPLFVLFSAFSLILNQMLHFPVDSDNFYTVRKIVQNLFCNPWKSVNMSSMGFLEYWCVYLHQMCWHPQESWGSYIQGQVSQPRPMDTGTDPVHARYGKY